jgi:hypothetical protein
MLTQPPCKFATLSSPFNSRPVCESPCANATCQQHLPSLSSDAHGRPLCKAASRLGAPKMMIISPHPTLHRTPIFGLDSSRNSHVFPTLGRFHPPISHGGRLRSRAVAVAIWRQRLGTNWQYLIDFPHRSRDTLSLRVPNVRVNKNRSTTGNATSRRITIAS